MTVGIEVTVKKREPKVVAYVSMKGPYSRMGEAFEKLHAWVDEHGFIPAVPPVGVYLNRPKEVTEDELRWEVQVPVAGFAEPTEPNDQGCGFKQLDEATVATTIHKGPYDQVKATYSALAHWIQENGYEIVGPPEEAYLSKPETEPDELLTEVRFPVNKK